NLAAAQERLLELRKVDGVPASGGHTKAHSVADPVHHPRKVHNPHGALLRFRRNTMMTFPAAYTVIFRGSRGIPRELAGGSRKPSGPPCVACCLSAWPEGASPPTAQQFWYAERAAALQQQPLAIGLAALGSAGLGRALAGTGLLLSEDALFSENAPKARRKAPTTRLRTTRLARLRPFFPSSEHLLG